jgi:hypothetical protein
MGGLDSLIRLWSMLLMNWGWGLNLGLQSESSSERTSGASELERG